MTKTLILDIDGTLVEQKDCCVTSDTKHTILPHVHDKIQEWEKKGYRLILITGRKEGSRRVTEKMLDDLGIHYDQLVMGVGTGPRVLVNDMKPDQPDLEMAVAINLKRNTGLGDINV